MPETNLSRPIPVVRLIVTDADGRVLLLRRAANTAGGNLWCLPGGKVDYGDTLEQAAARELEEETGLRARDLRFLFYQDSLPMSPGQMHCINLYFECRASGDVTINAESTAAAWIGPQDLPNFAIAFRHDEALERLWDSRSSGSSSLSPV
jgi:mutator protein MutT